VRLKLWKWCDYLSTSYHFGVIYFGAMLSTCVLLLGAEVCKDWYLVVGAVGVTRNCLSDVFSKFKLFGDRKHGVSSLSSSFVRG
jgi:hypothetical protein